MFKISVLCQGCLENKSKNIKCVPFHFNIVKYGNNKKEYCMIEVKQTHHMEQLTNIKNYVILSVIITVPVEQYCSEGVLNHVMRVLIAQ